MDAATLAKAADRFGFQFDTAGLVSFLVVLLVGALIVHVAARIVLERSSFLTAVAVVLAGNLLASLIAYLVPGTLGLVLAVAAWALVAAAFYRTRWLRGAVVGLVAWVIFLLVNLAIGFLLRQ